MAMTLLFALGDGSAQPSEGAGLRNSPGLDLEVGRAAFQLPPAQEGPGGEGVPPLVVRLGVRWSVLEPAAGRYEWAALDTAVDTAGQAGAEIILNIYGGHPAHTGGAAAPSPSDEEAISSWTALLREVAGRYAGRIHAYQVGRRPDAAATETGIEEAARAYAFVFKRSAVALRSADAGARVALATVDPSASDFVAILYDEEIAPYVDALSASFNGTERDRTGLASLAGLILVHDPSARIWVNGVQVLVGMEGYAQILRSFVAALEREAALITFQDPPDNQGRPFHLSAVQNIRGLFSAGYAPLVESGRGVRVLSASGDPLPGSRVSRFFDPDSKTVLMAYDGGGTAKRGDFGVFVVDTVDMAEPALHDLAAGESAPNVALQKDEATGLTRVALPLAEYPLVLSYKRFTTPEYAMEGEILDVTGERIPSAEEILAKHQAVQEAQDALLESVRAEAQEEWHFTFGTTGAFDVTFKESFYFDPEVGAEWEQKEVFVNGIRWKTKTIPELPFIQPEKAVSLPLKVSLSKEYRYTYEGREEVDGHDCYLISFSPVDETKNLSKGKVWIDTATFAKVRIAQAQSNQPAPIVSNDQRDTYTPVTGPDGFRYWILSRIDSQQIYSTTGRNFVITKEVALRDFVINGPEFEEHRGTALASSNTILRDTDKGLRYLKRKPDGSREVKYEPSHLNLFALGGVLANRSLPFPVPLAGINYFNSDFGGRGLQANVFFAGAFVLANLSDPSLFGSRFDASSELVGMAISTTDRLTREDRSTDSIEEEESEEITTKTQSLTTGIGLPFGKFFKLKGEGQLAYTDYGRTDDTCPDFLTPRDTYTRSGILTGEFNRRAWSVALQHTWSHRTRHEPWGDPNGVCPRPAGAVFPDDFLEEAGDYVRYSGVVAKNFYLPLNQRIRFRLTGRGSRDLDRFSKYRFSFFGDRLRGFSGAGLHYTNGGILRADYAFSLGEVIRFEAGVDFARVKDRQQLEPFRNHTGAGVAGQMAGPWNLLFRLEWGISVASDVEEFEGEQEILLTVLKLFSQR
jgi:hypothetical protein